MYIHIYTYTYVYIYTYIDEVSDALFADALAKNKKEINESIQKELKKMPR
jgi:cob(I)alamin adenosyltransferase